MRVITKITPDGSEYHCTSRCYNSNRRTCRCICRGLLHAKGEAYAKLNAPRASMYLNLQNGDDSKYLPPAELLEDMRGH